MQAITTKFLPATNHKPSRVKASCEAGSVTVSWWKEEKGISDQHSAAVKALCAKLKWGGTWYQGSAYNHPSGFIYVCADDRVERVEMGAWK